MSVEDKYDGPRLEASSGEVSSGDEGKGKPVVTLDFMKQLMAYYKDRKTLHRRYAFQVSSSPYYIKQEKIKGFLQVKLMLN